MNKKIIFFISFIFFYCLNFTHLFSAEVEIIPLKKPLLTEKEFKEKITLNLLKPLPKPKKKSLAKEPKKIDENQKKVKNIKLLPKKKPIIAGITAKNKITTSKYYNKKDFALAKKAINQMKKSNWVEALKISKKAKDKSIYNFIQWRHLLTKGNKASYYDYKTFIDSNEDYARINRVRYLSEHKLSTDTISPKKIIKWFENSDPLSGFGKLILGESYIKNGNNDKGISLIKEGWVNAELTKSELRFYRKNIKNFLMQMIILKELII